MINRQADRQTDRQIDSFAILLFCYLSFTEKKVLFQLEFLDFPYSLNRQATGILPLIHHLALMFLSDNCLLLKHHTNNIFFGVKLLSSIYMQLTLIIKALQFYLKVNLTMQENAKPRIEVFYVLEISKRLKTLQGSSGSRFADSSYSTCVFVAIQTFLSVKQPVFTLFWKNKCYCEINTPLRQ